METPFHPFIAHFPIALTFLIPVLALVFALMLKKNKMAPIAWLVVIGLQIFVTATGYIALESGETEEETVEKVVDEKFIGEHEEAAEIFVGSVVIALVVSIAAFFIRKEFQFYLQLGVAVLAIISCYLAVKTGQLGGQLVYTHGAAAAYRVAPEGAQGILPTPGMNTSETPVDDKNESLKPDENDYDSEAAGQEDDDLKQED